MSTLEALAKAVRRGAALVLLYFAVVLTWRFATMGRASGFDLMGGGVGLALYSLSLVLSEGKRKG